MKPTEISTIEYLTRNIELTGYDTTIKLSMHDIYIIRIALGEASFQEVDAGRQNTGDEFWELRERLADIQI